MVALTTLTAVSGVARSRSNDAAAGNGGRQRTSESSAPISPDRPHDGLPVFREQSVDGQSALPNLTLEDVLEHQGVVVITSNEPDSAHAEVTVSVEAAQPSEGDIEIEFVSGSDMEALYTQAVVDTPGAIQAPVSNVLLLNSGWAYRALSGSPLELPRVPPSQSVNDYWSPWRHNDEGWHEIQDPATGLWMRLTGTRVDISPKSHIDVSGSYRTTQVSNTLVNSSTSRHDLELSAEGLFSVSQSTLITGGALAPDNAFVLHVSRSATQRSTVFSGVVSSDGAALATVAHQQEQLTEQMGELFGSWEILEDGVTLELRFADGRVERRLFLQAQGSERLSIDGSTWWRHADAGPDLLARLWRLLATPEHNRESASWADLLARVELQSNRKREAPVDDPEISGT